MNTELEGFKKLSFDHFEKIYSIIERSQALDTAYSTVNTMGWQSFLQPSVYIDNDFVILALKMGDEYCFNSPLATSKESFVAAIKKIESFNVSTIQLVTDQWQVDALKELGYEIKPLRNMSEYLYNTSDLINLKGKKYHSKRNFINSFNYPYEFREYNPNDYDEIIDLMDNWNLNSSEKGSSPDASWSYIKSEMKLSDFDMEKDVLSRVLKAPHKFNFFLDVLIIDNNIQGFSGGELLPNNTGAIYFQKANTDYKGIYAVLDNLFIKKRFQNTKFINKQEDMGIEGLRKAKLSYYPVKLIERYIATKGGNNA